MLLPGKHASAHPRTPEGLRKFSTRLIQACPVQLASHGDACIWD